MVEEKDNELMVIKRQQERLKIKIVKTVKNNWSPAKYEKIIKGRDFNILAFFFYDLHNMGYNIEKAYGKYKALLNEPELFFL